MPVNKSTLTVKLLSSKVEQTADVHTICQTPCSWLHQTLLDGLLTWYHKLSLMAL